MRAMQKIKRILISYHTLLLLALLVHETVGYSQKAINIIETSKFGPQLNYAKGAICSQKCQQIGEVDYPNESQLLSFVGDLKSMFLRQETEIDSTLYEAIKKANLPFKGLGRLDSILDKSSVVIINEAHDRLIQRVFIYELLPLLKKKGFTHLAMETLASPLPELNASTGFYTSEPIMGEVFRRAVELGFKLICYESSDEQGINRDSIQAVNLRHQLFENGELPKTLIVCGYGHLYEWSSSPENKMMGEYFHELTGIDPLTIDQVLLGEYSDSKYTGSIYEALVSKEPTLFDKEDLSHFMPPFADIYLVHPKTTFHDNRPTCMLMNGDKKWVPFRLKDNTAILVQAYLKEEIKSKDDFNRCIPTDQTTYFDGDQFALAFKPGVHYLIVYRNKQNKIIRKSSYCLQP